MECEFIEVMSKNKSFFQRLLPVCMLLVVLMIGAGFYLLGQGKENHQTPSTASSSNPQYLHSFYQNSSEYETAFSSVGPVLAEPVLAGVTSHHFLAKELIARFFAGVDATHVAYVVVVSPDHFNQIKDPNVLGVTSTLSWETPFGILPSADDVIHKLSEDSPIVQDNSVFLTEHGVYTEIPFIKKYLPQAQVIPITLRGTDDYAEANEVGKKLSQIINPEQTLLVVSSDFTHHSTASDSAEIDRQSIVALRTAQLESVSKINSDCKVCMAFMFGYLANQPSRFSLIENKNSTNYGGEDKDVTSYVSAYFLHDKENSKKLSLLFGGDLMFDRNIRKNAQQNGYDFLLQNLTSTFEQFDEVVANLEGPVTENSSKSLGSQTGSSANFTFTFDSKITDTLKKNNFKVLNLGNNHILNFGKDGFNQTVDNLEKAGLKYFGDAGDASDQRSGYSRFYVQEIKGLKIGFVNYNQFVVDGLPHALVDLKAARKQADIVIVFPHWGLEYQTTANNVIQQQAHLFIDNGADIVIGSHPHVTQQNEVYKGKTIYYSLGNFVFDQYFQPETQHGLMVGIEIDTNTKEPVFTEIPIELKRNGQTVLSPPISGR
jgi:AmmeMemoRadiSam system protein B